MKNTAFYSILVNESLDESWSVHFGEISLSMTEDGHSLITGSFADQAALHGTLNKIRDLGLTLLSLDRTDVQNDDFLED